MRKFIFLLLISVVCFGQTNNIASDGGNVVQKDAEGNVNILGNLEVGGYVVQHNIYHVYGGFQDSSVEVGITKDQWSMVTNAGNNLWQSTEYDGFNVVGDTMIFLYTGDYFGIVALTFEGNQGNEYKFRLYNVTQDNVEGYVLGQTGEGNESYSGMPQPIYFEITAGDKIVMQVTNTSGNNAAVLKFGSFYAMYLHE